MKGFTFDLQRFVEIKNTNSYILLRGTGGDDSIFNGGYDSLHIGGSRVTITAGDGNDDIDNRGSNVTINAGAGNDLISLGSNAENILIEYSSGDGNDTIYGFKADDTLKISSGSFSTTASGNDVIVTVGDGKITLQDAASLSSVNIDMLLTLTEGDNEYNNTLSGATILALGGSDYITNSASASNVSISAGAGNDQIYAWGGSGVTINAGTGKDKIKLNLYDSENSVIEYASGDGNDLIIGFTADDTLKISGGTYSTTKSGNDVIVTVGDGQITLENAYATANNLHINGDTITLEPVVKLGDGGEELHAVRDSVSIAGGSGHDDIRSWGDSVTISGGAGNDYIRNVGANGSVDAGAGNDSIDNRGELGTITAGAGDDFIDLTPAAKNNLIFYSAGDGDDYIYGFTADDTLKISGGTYSTIKSGSDIIVTVGDGKISLDGAAKLETLNIDGEEENLWTLDGTIATCGDLIISGVKSLNGLKLSKKVVTVSASSLNKSDVTISDGYKLKLGSDVEKPSTKKSWTLDDTNATYGTTTTDGYKLSNNKISYTKKSSAALVTVSGVKSLDGLKLSKKVVTVSASSLNKSDVTISDGYKLKLGSDVDAPTNKKAGWTLKKTTATYKTASTTASYTLSNNTIVYSKAKGVTNLATIKGVESIDGLGVNGKFITAEASALASKVTVSSDDYAFDFGSDYKKARITGSDYDDTIRSAGQRVTIIGGTGDDSLVGSDKYSLLDGGDGKDTLISGGNGTSLRGGKGNDTLVGGKGNDSLWGGAGDDTLTGGAGEDTFIYYDGDGSDVITDYSPKLDTVIISSGDVKSSVGSVDSSGNVIFEIGSGQILFENCSSKTIELVNRAGKQIGRYIPR